MRSGIEIVYELCVIHVLLKVVENSRTAIPKLFLNICILSSTTYDAIGHYGSCVGVGSTVAVARSLTR